MFSRKTIVLFLLAILGISLWPGVKLLPDQPREKVIAQSEEILLTPTASTTATVSLTPTFSVTPPETTTATVTTTPSVTATEEPTTTPTATVTEEPTVPPSPTATVTPTMTPVPAAGTLAGTVTLQGRRNWAGVQIEADNVVMATTASDGTFSVDLQPGTYLVRARIAGYLPAEKPGVEITSEQATMLPTVTLRGGDVNGDNKVGLQDLVIVAAAYDTAPPADPRGDINNDGRIDIFDLVLVASNYWLDGPLPWPEMR